jgi:putative two-component system response regulator
LATPWGGKAVRVYIIDDSNINLMLFEEIILRIGVEVEIETYLDPVDGLARCIEQLPDLLVVDYMMPGLDGHEVIEQVRQLPNSADVPIVMVTATDEPQVRIRALQLGATDFIAKPIDPHEVKARLFNLLSLRRNHLLLQDTNVWLAEEVRKATKVIADREVELINRLARAAEFRDPETGAHITRMALYSRLIAQSLTLPADTCDDIFRTAPMHDIGKLGIPDGILLKPGRLNEHERTVIKRHPEIGYLILMGSESPLIKLGAEIALNHHEKVDGTGYPRGLSGDQIPLSGRIVAVADVLDALTTERPYKRAWSLDRARDFLLENCGTHFDQTCVDALLANWDEVKHIHEQFCDPPLPGDELVLDDQ